MDEYKKITFSVPVSVYSELQKLARQINQPCVPKSVLLGEFMRAVLADYLRRLKTVAECEGMRVTVVHCHVCGAIGSGAVPRIGEAPLHRCLSCICKHNGEDSSRKG